ncbi:MAG: GTPase HflX [Betaproteobacteria bacterium]|nr:MAG: GTPase HflX [Betaproteobacteria bacterium]
MSEQRGRANAAVLVGLDFNAGGYSESLDELRLLVESAGLKPSALIQGKRQRPDPALYAGSGKVEEIAAAVREQNAVVTVFNHELSPAQQRNLEKKLDCPVLDRTGLILGIFARRARSHEGKLQVELAQLEYASTRLVRGWTHLERQRGGRGFLGGMGETQIEVDRRLIGNRVKVLKDKLVQFKRRRDVQRRARVRGDVLSVSLVGYTNAGKSTLFNALTHADSYTADQLFATLDTTTRRMYVEGAGNLVLSDTVGFIRDLPHGLVASFRATLEETIHADLLLHVVDASSGVREAQIVAVNAVLAEIGAEGIPQVLVWNKTDLTPVLPGLERDEYGKICRVSLSAKTGDGMDFLRTALAEIAAAKKSATTNLEAELHHKDSYVT